MTNPFPFFGSRRLLSESQADSLDAVRSGNTLHLVQRPEKSEASSQVRSSGESYYEMEEPEAPGSQLEGAALHRALKGTEIWFGLQLSQLERYCTTKAEEFANAGLPRIDIEAAGELSIETVLRHRAERVLLDWANIIRRKVLDSIHGACIAANRALVEMRDRVEIAELEHRVLGEKGIEEDLDQADSSSLDAAAGFERSLPQWSYFALIVLLVAIDWIANVPVFRELLPQDPGSEQAWRAFLERAENVGLFSGLLRMIYRAFFYPEAAVLALGVIIFLIFLAHVFGVSLKKLILLRGHREIFSDNRRLQAWASLSLAGLAVPLVIMFLFLSRGQIQSSAQMHLHEIERRIESTQKQELDAEHEHDEDAARGARFQLAALKLEGEQRSQDLDYASKIHSMNAPILMLNFVLVLAASIAAYLAHSERIELEPELDLRRGDEQVGINSQPQASLLELRQAFESNVAIAKYLGAATPFRAWQSKYQALEAIIPLFRSENALRRGVDVQNIRGFGAQTSLNVSAPNDSEMLGIPKAVEEYEREYRELESRLAKLFV